MTIRRNLAPWILCVLLASGCSSPVRNDVRYSPTPAQRPAYPGGSIGVSLGYTNTDGTRGQMYKGEAASFESGVRVYMDVHRPGWRVVGASSPATIRLHCEHTQDGSSSCSDFVYRCAIELDERETIFERRLESDTCMQGGVADSFLIQAYNHGQEIAQTLVETLPTLSGLKEKVAEEALDEALRSSGTRDLQRVVDTYSGTPAADRAQGELVSRVDQNRRQAEQRAAVLDARRAEARQELERLKTSGDPIALESFAQAYSDLGPEARQARALAAALRGDVTDPEQREPPEQRGFTLSCFDPRNRLCGDYGFSTASKREAFATQCRSLGSQVLDGQCDASGAIGCAMRSGSTTTTTWAYRVDRTQFASSCRANRGSVIGR